MPRAAAEGNAIVLVRIGVALGLGTAVLIALVVHPPFPHRPPYPNPWPAYISAAGLQAAPFALALLGFLVSERAARAGIWIGSGAAGLVSWLPSVSPVGMVLGSGAAIVLLVGGARTLERGTPRRAWVPTALVLVVAAVSAISVFWLANPGRCWLNTQRGWFELPRGFTRLPGSLGGTCGSPIVTVGGALNPFVLWIVPIALVLNRRRGVKVSRTG